MFDHPHLLNPVVKPETTTDLLRIKEQLRQHLYRSSAGSVPVSKHLCAEIIKEDGSWNDLDYADQTGGHWPAALHLQRVLDAARTYTSPIHPSKGDRLLSKIIHSALRYWLAKDYSSPNWWHNQIGVPRNLGQIMLLMESELSSQEMADGLRIIARAKIGMTGQNRIWLAENVLMRGLLENDEALVRNARDEIFGEVTVSAGEGIQPDSSFHQHGPMLQIGNYGLAFALDCAALAEVLRGTQLAMGEAKRDILRKYLMDGIRYVCWKGRMDISSCGRQLWPGAPASKYEGYVEALQTMQHADPEMHSQYQAEIESSSNKSGPDGRFVGNKHFWRSDYMVDRRPGYYESARMSSSRVIGTEEINFENLQGFHLGDGVLFLYQDGSEYEDIFPVWDWRKLPGITAAQTTGPVPIARITFHDNSAVAEMMNEGDFVGGVSDGRNGGAVLDYNRSGVTAKKSWFFFEGRIVCLGSKISSEKDVPVVTCLNQCLLRGDVIVGQENVLPKRAVGREEVPSLKWAWHDNIGYVFPSPVSVIVGGESQRGTWKSVYRAGDDSLVEKGIFAMWMDHGTRPQDANYSYVILPSMTAEEVQAYVLHPDVQVCSNTEELQAAARGGRVLAAFHQPGELNYSPDKQIRVDQACLVMVEECACGSKLTLADPTQKLDGVRVVLNGKSVSVQFPKGPNAGSSLVLEGL